MKNEIHSKLEKIGFYPVTAVNIEYPSQTFLSTVPKGTNRDTNIYIYYKTNKDFVVLIPQMYMNDFRVTYYGEVDDIKKEVQKLKGDV